MPTLASVNNIILSSGITTLAGLTDINTTAPASNQTLLYDSGSNTWVNKNVNSRFNGLYTAATTNVGPTTEFVYIPWNSATITSSDTYTHTAGSDTIQILETGEYMILGKCCLDPIGSAFNEVQIKIFTDTAGDDVFFNVTGTTSYTFVPASSLGGGITLNITTLLPLTANTQLKIGAQASGGASFILKQNACNISLVKL
jgi:hypothetical protein